MTYFVDKTRQWKKTSMGGCRTFCLIKKKTLHSKSNTLDEVGVCKKCVSNETQLKRTDGRARIFSIRNQQDPTSHVLTDQAGRASLMVWECFLAINVSQSSIQHIWVSVLSMYIHSWPQFTHLLIAASNMIKQSYVKGNRTAGIAVFSTWSLVWKECFQNCVESMLQKVEAVLRATQY